MGTELSLRGNTDVVAQPNGDEVARIRPDGQLYSEEQVRDFLDRALRNEVLAVDTEGYFEMDNRLLDASQTVGVSIAGHDFDAYFPFNHYNVGAHIGYNLPADLRQAVTKTISSHPCVVFHNAKHDTVALSKVECHPDYFYDTMLMAHLIDENDMNFGLNWQSQKYGGLPKQRPNGMTGIINTIGWAYVPVCMMAPYGANDAGITYDLYYNLMPEFESQGFDGKYWDTVQQFSRLIGSMELQGVAIDTEFVEREIARGIEQQKEISHALGVVPTGKTLERLLLEELGLPVVARTPKGKPSFTKDAMKVYDELLSRTNDKRAQLILQYKGWVTALGLNYRPYLERLSSDGRIRCNYKLHGTTTGRLSCSLPNLQQIPRSTDKDWNGGLKKSFKGEPGWSLWEGDYSQLEFRLGAAYAREHRLLDIFNDPTRDVFNEIASDLRMARQDVKTLTYTIQYGGGVRRISDVFGVTPAAAKAIRDQYYSKYPGLRKVSYLASQRAMDTGYVAMWSGRRRHFQDPETQAHKAFNAVIQGGAAEVVKHTMLRLRDLVVQDECRMLLQVHDSVVFEIRDGLEHKYIPEIKAIMEDVRPNFKVKFKADIHRWGE